MVTFITEQGFEQSILQCDGEPALVKLVDELGPQTSLPTGKSPASSQQLQEWQKNLFAQFRALLSDFFHRYRLQSSEVEIGSSLGQHMLRHAESLLNRFQLHSSDNKTSLQRRWGIAYSSSVLPFGELVLAPDLSLAIWLGRCESSDEHILAMANSNSAVKSNSVTRLSLDSSMELTLFKSISIPPPELASAAYLKMAELGDQTSEQAGGARELRLEYQPQAYTKHPQPEANGRQPRALPSSFELTPGLAHLFVSQACSYEFPDLGWQQPALHQPQELQSTALHPPVVQQPPSATTTLIERVLNPPSRRQPSEEQASQQQPVRRCPKQNGSKEIANKLHSILEKARTFQEIELAVTSGEESRESQAAVQHAQLQAYFEDDLSLFPAEEVKKAKQQEGESLKGIYEQVSKQSLTTLQLQQVICPTWTFEAISSHEGESSLRARLIDKAFQHQILDRDLTLCASTSHMSLKILLTLSLINKWAVSSATVSSALLSAPTAIEELVLVAPPPELEPNPDVLWQLIRKWYGIKTSPKLWQHSIASKLEELGLKKNTVDPSTFVSEQLLVMHHLGALLLVGDKLQQESFVNQLSAHVSLTTTKLDPTTPLSFLNMTLEHNKQEHSISW